MLLNFIISGIKKLLWMKAKEKTSVKQQIQDFPCNILYRQSCQVFPKKETSWQSACLYFEKRQRQCEILRCCHFSWVGFHIFLCPIICSRFVLYGQNVSSPITHNWLFFKIYITKIIVPWKQQSRFFPPNTDGQFSKFMFFCMF